MRYGVWVPNFGEYSDPRTLVSLACEAEEAGWDGFFLWDHVLRTETVPVADPWIALAAIATSTERLRIGPMVTPIPRRRPSKLAREIVSLDHLSNGRVTLGVGLGSPPESEFTRFGEDADPRIRAEKLDEGLEILTGLFTGEKFRYEGSHYRVEEAVFLPKPVQSPRVPIWVAGMWPKRGPFRRAARWDGVFPLKGSSSVPLPSPDDIREIAKLLASLGVKDRSFDVVVTGTTPGKDRARAAETILAFREAGATWWLEWTGWRRGPLREMRERIRQGPVEVA